MHEAAGNLPFLPSQEFVVDGVAEVQQFLMRQAA
jgi:hypothetical protein